MDLSDMLAQYTLDAHGDSVVVSAPSGVSAKIVSAIFLGAQHNADSVRMRWMVIQNGCVGWYRKLIAPVKSPHQNWEESGILFTGQLVEKLARAAVTDCDYGNPHPTTGLNGFEKLSDQIGSQWTQSLPIHPDKRANIIELRRHDPVILRDVVGRMQRILRR